MHDQILLNYLGRMMTPMEGSLLPVQYKHQEGKLNRKVFENVPKMQI